jgi:hypothetical protein
VIFFREEEEEEKEEERRRALKSGQSIRTEHTAHGVHLCGGNLNKKNKVFLSLSFSLSLCVVYN